MPGVSFELFSSLPPELQDIILQFALISCLKEQEDTYQQIAEAYEQRRLGHENDNDTDVDNETEGHDEFGNPCSYHEISDMYAMIAGLDGCISDMVDIAVVDQRAAKVAEPFLKIAWEVDFEISNSEEASEITWRRAINAR